MRRLAVLAVILAAMVLGGPALVNAFDICPPSTADPTELTIQTYHCVFDTPIGNQPVAIEYWRGTALCDEFDDITSITGEVDLYFEHTEIGDTVKFIFRDTTYLFEYHNPLGTPGEWQSSGVEKVDCSAELLSTNHIRIFWPAPEEE